MEVKIQYAVDLEDVPFEITRLCPETLDWTTDIEKINSSLADVRTNNTMQQVVERMSRIRRGMFRADRRLADCMAILEGYLNVKNTSQSEEEEEEDDSTS